MTKTKQKRGIYKMKDDGYKNTPDFIENYISCLKKDGLIIKDGHQTVICMEPLTRFTIMISRSSEVVQCYYMGCGSDFSERIFDEFESVEDLYEYSDIMKDVLSKIPGPDYMKEDVYDEEECELDY